MPDPKHQADVLADQTDQAANAYDLPGVKRAADMLRRIPALEAERDRLLAEVEGLRRDAERYRWLRDNGDWRCTEKDGYGGQTLMMGDRLDAAVEAAIAATEPSEPK